jgi:hypothetical protein
MKLWEIKAQALRIMFADTDIEFSLSEFEDGSIYTNANTREKLILMNASIKRAIDMYYQHNREITKIWNNIPLVFSTEEIEEEDVYTFLNELNVATKPADFSYPTRVDLLEDKLNYIYARENVDFYYDELADKILFLNEDYASIYDDEIKLAMRFRVYYKIDIKNLPEVVSNEITFELNSETNVPEDVQRMIPYFIKAELYEEDEPSLAQQAKQEYMSYVIQRQRKQFSKVQTKVKNKFPKGY